jgi:hypothetical protein
MKQLITLLLILSSALVTNAQTDSLCLCELDLTLPEVNSKLKLVKTKTIKKTFKGEKGNTVEANLYKLTYKYNSNDVTATFVTGRVANKNVQPQYAESVTVKAKGTSVELFGCPVNTGKKGKYINCTR